jgi:CheY-like chemotaxis protein
MATPPRDLPPAGAGGGVAPWSCSPTALVIDDNDDIRDNLGEILVHEGYVCWLAASADEACERLRAGDAPPSVILLDWRLPGMAPERFVSIVRERAGWASAPIVVQTGASDGEIPSSLRVDGIVRKPFDVPALLALLRNVLASRGASADDPGIAPPGY